MPEDLPAFDLDRFLPYRLSVAAEQVSADLAREYKSRFGISVAEWRVLLNLGYSGTGSVRDIERLVSLEKSKVSRAVSRLVKKGYVEKQTNEGDKRLLRLSLTDEGSALLHQLIPIAVRYHTRLENRLSHHLDSLHAALDQVSAR